MAWFVLCLESTVSSREERDTTERFWYLEATAISEMDRASSQMVRTAPSMTGREHRPPSPLRPPREKVPERNS